MPSSRRDLSSTPVHSDVRKEAAHTEPPLCALHTLNGIEKVRLVAGGGAGGAGGGGVI